MKSAVAAYLGMNALAGIAFVSGVMVLAGVGYALISLGACLAASAWFLRRGLVIDE